MLLLFDLPSHSASIGTGFYTVSCVFFFDMLCTPSTAAPVVAKTTTPTVYYLGNGQGCCRGVPEKGAALYRAGRRVHCIGDARNAAEGLSKRQQETRLLEIFSEVFNYPYSSMEKWCSLKRSVRWLELAE